MYVLLTFWLGSSSLADPALTLTGIRFWFAVEWTRIYYYPPLVGKISAIRIYNTALDLKNFLCFRPQFLAPDQCRIQYE